MSKVTNRDIVNFFGMRELEKKFRLKVKYRREKLTEEKYTLDKQSLRNHNQLKKINP